MKYPKVLLLCIICSVTFFTSCDEEGQSPIPYRPVKLTLYLSDRDSDLIPTLAAKTFTEPRDASDRIGFGGILVINGFTTGGINIYAYDLACPVEMADSSKLVRIIPDDVGCATCPQCGELYELGYGKGVPTKGISKHTLRTYGVSYKGSNRYQVLN
ncbi:hypothetical protein M2138_001457 [Dysgonomonadaceae bacterium PH5-43]|nr:hypothetical protein [Dysgonomonadaceae bacterium PH5-43]